jgi:pimeloyl-ACP methyl ester carboxylesterase
VHRIAPVLGGSLAYTIAGSGSVLLLVHGLGGSRDTWRHVIGPLSATHTVIAVDLPGHGESDAPAGDYSLGAHATALRDLLLMLGHERASVAGHSLGGGVALQFAYQFPERIERLLLISSGGLGSEVTALLRGATLPGAESVVAGLSQLPAALTRPILLLLPGLIARRDCRPLAAGLRDLRGAGQRRAFVRTARGVIDAHGQTVSASRHLNLLADVPTLIAWGARDKTIPPQHHRDLAARLPEAHTAEIVTAGHYPHETDPDQLAPAVQAFLTATIPYAYDEGRWRERLSAATADPAAALAANPPRMAEDDYQQRPDIRGPRL